MELRWLGCGGPRAVPCWLARWGVGVRRLSREAVTALGSAVADPGVVARYASKVVQVPGSDCLWWTGAISGRGHGRFWLSQGRVVIAHRFAFAIAHGSDELDAARVLGHRCDNPLCQRIGPGHVVVSSPVENRREWARRRQVIGTPLADPRGTRDRTRTLRDLARRDPASVALDLASVRALLGEQAPLW